MLQVMRGDPYFIKGGTSPSTWGGPTPSQKIKIENKNNLIKINKNRKKIKIKINIVNNNINFLKFLLPNQLPFNFIKYNDGGTFNANNSE